MMWHDRQNSGCVEYVAKPVPPPMTINSTTSTAPQTVRPTGSHLLFRRRMPRIRHHQGRVEVRAAAASGPGCCVASTKLSVTEHSNRSAPPRVRCVQPAAAPDSPTPADRVDYVAVGSVSGNGAVAGLRAGCLAR